MTTYQAEVQITDYQGRTITIAREIEAISEQEAIFLAEDPSTIPGAVSASVTSIENWDEDDETDEENFGPDFMTYMEEDGWPSY